MVIAVGDKLPDVPLRTLNAEGGVDTVSPVELTKGKKVILVGVPGAFTPTCHKQGHGFVDKAASFKAKGIDTIAIVANNDAFVMDAWKKSLSAPDDMIFLGDGNTEFVKALGATFDGSGFGLGIRGSRFAMLVEDSEVKVLNLEDGGAFACSSADTLYDSLA